MLGTKHVFVSFSVAGDQPGRSYVRLLLSRLAEQPDFCVWIYESPGGKISSGSSISDTCRTKIDASDLFVVLVTDQALRSDYVAMEVSHALWARTQRDLKIYPLVATSVARDHWPVSLQEVVGFRGQFAALDIDRVDDVVWDICIGLDIDYKPPIGNDPRMPLRHRIVNEIRDHRSKGGMDVGDFQRLLDRCDKATRLMAVGRSGDALRIADALLLDFECDYDGLQPYYLRIFRACCLLAEAQAGRRSFEHAYRTFDEIEGSASPSVDANVYAGRGHALLHLCRYQEALRDYESAERMLSRMDPALLYSQTRAQILAGQGVNPQLQDKLEQVLNEGLICTQIGDSARVAAVLALAFAHTGNVERTRRAWERVTEPSDVGSELVSEICHWLQSRVSSRTAPDAIALCQQMLDERMNVNPKPHGRDEILLLRQLARVYAFAGDQIRARHQWHYLLERYPHHAPVCAEAALFAVDSGDAEEAAHLCKHTIEVGHLMDEDPLVDRTTNEAAIGLAFWLLGREAEARECHRRSLQAEEHWFGVTLPNHFGLAAKSRLSLLIRNLDPRRRH